MSDKKIVYDSLPGAREGETCLSIYPPGTWMDTNEFVVFVGGCGVGRADNEGDAAALLKAEAIFYCTERIERAEQELAHYYHLRMKLRNLGLSGRRVVTEK